MLIASVLTLTVLLSSCRDTKPGSTAAEQRPIGAGVTITGREVPTAVTAQQATLSPLASEPAASVAAGVELSPPGPLPRPADLTVPLSRAPSQDDVAIAFTAAAAAGPWTGVPVRVDAATRKAALRLTEASYLAVVLVDLTRLLPGLRDELVKGFVGAPYASAKRPSCSDEKAARTDGYSISSSAKGALYWCLGIEGGSRVVKVVNRKSYPLLLNYGSRLRPREKEELGWDSAWIAEKAAGKNRLPLLPGGQVTLELDLAAGQKARLSTEFDGVAHSLAQLQLGLETAITLTTRLGAGAPPWAADRTKALLDVANATAGLAGCGSGLDGSWGKLLRKCLLPALQGLNVSSPMLQLLNAVFFWNGIIAFFTSSWTPSETRSQGTTRTPSPPSEPSRRRH